MIIIQRYNIVAILSLLTPLTAFAEKKDETKNISVTSSATSNSAAWRSSEVIGHNVKNAKDETIGEIEDLLVDMSSGQIQGVVISSGGFLGIADTLSVVPVSALRFDVDAKTFKTKLTKEQLSKAPQFNKSKWLDFSDVTTMEAMRSYRDSIGGDVNAPDNSAQNEKTQNHKTMIPTDQGNSEKDIQITQNIRSSVVDTDMSFNAKNIKIITKNEHVVLKGVVETSAEHQAILKIAKDHAASSNITDELKVNTK